MIRKEKDYNQIRLFIRYVVGRKSPQKLIAYIKEQFSFHNKIKLAQTPDGITLKVSYPSTDIFVPLGPEDNPTCTVYLSLIGSAIFASSHSTYVKRTDFVKQLRLKESASLKPDLEVLIPNMAPYIKRLNERVGYKIILNKKIGREAGYFFEKENFRGNLPVPYHMDKRKFTHTWSTGERIIFFTSPGGSWEIVPPLKDKNIHIIPVFEEKEIKGIISRYKPKMILFDQKRSIDEGDMFGYIKPELKDPKLPVKYFAMKENGGVELWDDSEKKVCETEDGFARELMNILKKKS